MKNGHSGWQCPALGVWAKAPPKHEQKGLRNPLPFRILRSSGLDYVASVPFNLHSP